MTRANTPKDFFARIANPDSNGCQIWTGGLFNNGYGQFLIRGKTWLAHRYAWTRANGQIPKDMHVCHQCDNPQCVNPDHLFLGTHQENMLDRDTKGRCRSKLTEDQVLKIHKDKRSHRKIAPDYGVSPAQIGKIKQGKSWSYLWGVSQ